MRKALGSRLRIHAEIDEGHTLVWVEGHLPCRRSAAITPRGCGTNGDQRLNVSRVNGTSGILLQHLTGHDGLRARFTAYWLRWKANSRSPVYGAIPGSP
jgi:hypothetical protein